MAIPVVFIIRFKCFIVFLVLDLLANMATTVVCIIRFTPYVFYRILLYRTSVSFDWSTYFCMSGFCFERFPNMDVIYHHISIYILQDSKRKTCEPAGKSCWKFAATPRSWPSRWQHGKTWKGVFFRQLGLPVVTSTTSTWKSSRNTVKLQIFQIWPQKLLKKNCLMPSPAVEKVHGHRKGAQTTSGSWRTDLVANVATVPLGCGYWIPLNNLHWTEYAFIHTAYSNTDTYIYIYIYTQSQKEVGKQT